MSIIGNEVESLTEVLKMIGGNNDYMAAIILTAFVEMYKDSVNVFIGEELESVYIHIYNKKYPPKMLIDAVLPKKYEDLFGGESNG